MHFRLLKSDFFNVEMHLGYSLFDLLMKEYRNHQNIQVCIGIIITPQISSLQLNKMGLEVGNPHFLQVIPAKIYICMLVK